MPRPACAENLYLVDQLAIKARRVSDPLARIYKLIAADGNIPFAQRSAEMQSIGIELQILMEDWQNTHKDLQSHKRRHRC
jgi:hypothetical protein